MNVHAIIGVRAFHDINQSWIFFNTIVPWLFLWFQKCMFTMYFSNMPASPEQYHRLVQFLTFIFKLTSMVIYDKRTTSVILTAIINCHNFIVVYQPLLRMKSIFYNWYVALDFAVCIHTFCNGNLLLAPIYFKGFPVVGSRAHVLFTLFVLAYT